MSLLDPADVRALVPQEDFSDAQLEVTMRLVAGWLREDSGRDSLPSPLPPDDPLWAPALELVAVFAENPTSLASRIAGPTSSTWPQARRRDAVRTAVRERYSRENAGPRGTFPPPPAWPDPVVRPATSWWWAGP